MNVTPTEDDIFTALTAFLVNVLPAAGSVGFEVVQGQDNRVPEPVGPDYVVMWPLRMPRLSTTVETLLAGGLQASFEQSSQCVIQCDVHGPASFDNASVLSTLFRSSYAVDFFANLGDTIAPLHADDPRQAPFNSGEQQVENRYIVEVNMQVNQTVTATAESATALELGVVDVNTDPDTWPNSVVTAP